MALLLLRTAARALALAAIVWMAVAGTAFGAGPVDGTWTAMPPPENLGMMFLDPTDDRITFLDASYLPTFWKFDATATTPWTTTARQGNRPQIGLLFGSLVDRSGERLLAVGCDFDFTEDGPTYGPTRICALSLRGSKGWETIATVGAGPSQREETAIAYDERDGILYLVAGRWLEFRPGEGYIRHPLGDTWSIALQGDRTWREVSLAGPGLPGVLARYSFFDPGERRIVLVAARDTLEDALDGRKGWALGLEGDRVWTPLAPLPTYGINDRGLFDPARRELLAVDIDRAEEYPYLDSLVLQTFDPSGAGRWSRSHFESLPPASTPSLDGYRVRYAVDAQGRLVAFGGSGILRSESPVRNFSRADVWRTPLTGPCAWEQLFSAIAPNECEWHAPVVLDPTRDRLVAAASRLGTIGGLFSLPLDRRSGWNFEMTSSLGPGTRRLGAATVFDVAGERLLLFGGGFDGLEYGDLWELSFAFSPPRWRRIVTGDESPRPRRDAALVYDPVRHRAILFGGFAGEAVDDTWQLDLRGSDPTWSRIETPGVIPTARWGSALVYDARRDRLVLYAGATGPPSDPTMLRDSWALALEPGGGWSMLSVDGSSPVGRSSPAAFYDPRADRMVVLGGLDGFGSRFDHHALEFGTPSRWREFMPAGAGLSTSDTRTALYDAPRDQAIVVGTERPIGGIVHALVFDRPGLEPPPFPEGGAPFRLLGVGPNPSSGDVSIAFDVPRPIAVRLRLYDVRGRVVRDLGDQEFQPGPHVLRWDGRGDDGTRLRDGVYFARLEVEGQVVTGKLVLMD